MPSTDKTKYDDKSLADMMVDGEICQMCTFPLAEEHGFPQTCTDCGGNAKRAEPEDHSCLICGGDPCNVDD